MFPAGGASYRAGCWGRSDRSMYMVHCVQLHVHVTAAYVQCCRKCARCIFSVVHVHARVYGHEY